MGVMYRKEFFLLALVYISFERLSTQICKMIFQNLLFNFSARNMLFTWNMSNVHIKFIARSFFNNFIH
jgi:hypothetical protein